jgi:hypothetical protein
MPVIMIRQHALPIHPLLHMFVVIVQITVTRSRQQKILLAPKVDLKLLQLKILPDVVRVL